MKELNRHHFITSDGAKCENYEFYALILFPGTRKYLMER